MKNESEQLDALQDIRKMMKESSRFLSLSGMSGVLAGCYALGGAYVAHLLIRDFSLGHQKGTGGFEEAYAAVSTKLIALALVVLGLSLVTAFVLSGRKAMKRGHRLFDHSSRNLVWSMAVPLFSGGIFCLALVARRNECLLFICPAMLLFYGLALVSSSRLTLSDLKTLGYLEILLGLGACFYPEYGLVFWSLGFGFLHIVYGTIMWYKYDRKI